MSEDSEDELEDGMEGINSLLLLVGVSCKDCKLLLFRAAGMLFDLSCSQCGQDVYVEEIWRALI